MQVGTQAIQGVVGEPPSSASASLDMDAEEIIGRNGCRNTSAVTSER